MTFPEIVVRDAREEHYAQIGGVSRLVIKALD